MGVVDLLVECRLSEYVDNLLLTGNLMWDVCNLLMFVDVQAIKLSINCL